MLVFKEEQAFIIENKVEFKFYKKHVFFKVIENFSKIKTNQVIHDPLKKTYTLLKKGKPVARYIQYPYRKTKPQKTFYRVEHRSKVNKDYGCFLGPYSEDKKLWGDKKGRTHNDSKHPGVSRNCLHYDESLASKKVDSKDYFLYGFESLKSLKEWFSKTELQKLESLGYIITEYQSCDYHIGKNQVAFRPLGERKLSE